MPSPLSTEMRKSIHKETAPNPQPIQEQRKLWLDFAQTVALAPGTILKEELIGGVQCLWVSGSKTNDDTSFILYLHGGGLVDGAILTHREFASRLSGTTGLPVLLVEYRLAPEYPFPAALDDALTVYRELIGSRSVDPGSIIFGGDSSGGGLVVSAMCRLRDQGTRLPKCAFTVSGVFDMTLSGESMKTRDALDPCLSYAALKGWIRYFEDEPGLDDPLLSPLLGNLHGLPPMLIQVGEHEVWYDDSARLATRIKASGGSVTLSVWDSMWHVWPMYNGLPEATEAIEEIRDFIFQEEKHLFRNP